MNTKALKTSRPWNYNSCYNLKSMTALFLSFIILISFTVSSYAADIKVYGCIKNTENKIALTFDDGPHPKFTEMILDILKEYDIKATFFMVGENIKYYPDVAKRVAEEGHEIGNHTFAHGHIPDMSISELEADIRQCENEIYSVCGYMPYLFRPPEGCYDKNILNLVGSMGYDVVLWSIDTLDWKTKNKSKIKDTVIGNTKSGDIILMHDYVSKSQTPEALRAIIPLLKNSGYTFVTVSELISLSKCQA